jgi:tetratricopeptide (TPR) repeat protein
MVFRPRRIGTFRRSRSGHIERGGAVLVRRTCAFVCLHLCLSGGALLATAPGPAQGPQGPVPVPGARRVPDRRPLTLQGWIVASARQLERIGVRIETSGGTLNDFTYSEPSGRFEFRDLSFDPAELYYIVVEAEGFETYRERLDYHIGPRRAGRLTVLLEPEGTAGVAAGTSSPLVDLSQLAAVIPDEARDDYERALDDIDSGDNESAIEHLERAVEAAPDFYDALIALGAEYLDTERYRDADAVLTRTGTLSPAAAAPLLQLGTLRYKEGEADFQAGRTVASTEKFVSAVDLLEEGIRRDPFSSRAHHNLGAALYRLQEYAAAEASLNRALELSPDLDDARLVLINVYTRQHRYDDALAQLNAYLDENPDAPQREALERVREQIRTARRQ